MNNSNNEQIPTPVPDEQSPSLISDALIDEVEDTMTRLGRLMASRHSGQDMCHGDLSSVQTMLMRTLEASTALKMTDVAALLAIKPPAASAMVDGLERHGFVERTPSDEDRRVTLVHLTETGRTVLAEAEETRRSHMRRYLELVSEDDIRTLLRIQHTFIDAIEAGLI